MKVFLINGAPCSGKSTFCEKVIQITTDAYGKQFSTVDLVKQVAHDLGWNGEKTPKARKFLSDLKDILTEWDDIPVKDIKNKINVFKWELDTFLEDDSKAVVFIHTREPEEIMRLRNELGAQSILIRRKEAEENNPASCHSDANVMNCEYDIEIDNNGSLIDLTMAALEFVEKHDLYIDYNKNLQIDFEGNLKYN